MKVFVCLEAYHNSVGMEKGEKQVYVLGVFKTAAEVEKEVGKRLDEVAEEITNGDENNESAISETVPWNGKEAAIESQWCDRWEWSVAECAFNG